MKIACVAFVLLLAAGSCSATPPKLEALDRLLDRFWSEDLEVLKRISGRLARDQPSDSDEVRSLREGVQSYLRNISTDVRLGLASAKTAENPRTIIIWYSRLGTDVEGFRRAVDQLVIISLRSNPQFIDDSIEFDLRRLWDVERELSWRLGSEVTRSISVQMESKGSD